MTAPNDKPPPTGRPSVSFNMWLTLQGPESPFAALRAAWRTSRGRLTRATVVERAQKAGVTPGLAGDAYDTYCLAAGIPLSPVPAPTS